MHAGLQALMSGHAQSGGAFFPTDSDGNPSGFNTTSTFYPASDAASKVEDIPTFVYADALDGTGIGSGSRGERDRLENKDGRVISETYELEVPASIAVRRKQPSNDKDKFKLADGTVLTVTRIRGKDTNLQTVLCERVSRMTERKTKDS